MRTFDLSHICLKFSQKGRVCNLFGEQLVLAIWKACVKGLWSVKVREDELAYFQKILQVFQNRLLEAPDQKHSNATSCQQFFEKKQAVFMFCQSTAVSQLRWWPPRHLRVSCWGCSRRIEWAKVVLCMLKVFSASWVHKAAAVGDLYCTSIPPSGQRTVVQWGKKRW